MPAELQSWLALLASFWVTFDTFTKAATFVNRMRELVATGKDGSSTLTYAHRCNIFMDRCLSIYGIVFCAFIYAVVVFKVSGYFLKTNAELSSTFWWFALVPLAAALIFLICGVSDLRFLIKELRSAKKP